MSAPITTSNLEIGMRSHFLAAAPVAALIVDRFHPAGRIAGGVLPAVTFRRVDWHQQRHLGGAVSLRWHVYEITSVAATKLDAMALRDAVEAAISRDGFAGVWDGVTVDAAYWVDEDENPVEPFAADDARTFKFASNLKVYFQAAT